MSTCFARIVDRLERSGVDLEGDEESSVGGEEGQCEGYGLRVRVTGAKKVRSCGADFGLDPP